ncbi:hypothetical protein Clacol_008375 [Clathrus columnatus]|uniref:Antibiotic biosynthesis monooxygenase n=1 Tax=Clathrus columnatus TaxID=1419009 RepID=A0AAV5AKU8_9AGAM|nr:hypothetical protein Clacol_008375 [Clathrus columnatus]
MSATVGLFVPLVAKPEQSQALSDFIGVGRQIVSEKEPLTKEWFGVKFSETEYAIFDTFADDTGRDAHLSGDVAKALGEHGPNLLSENPQINKVEILTSLVRAESATIDAKLGLYVPLVAKPEQAETVKAFLISAQSIVAEQEPKTLQWYAFRKSETEFGIFDTAASQEGIDAHLNGHVAAKLMANAAALLAEPPVIKNHEILHINIRV